MVSERGMTGEENPKRLARRDQPGTSASNNPPSSHLGTFSSLSELGAHSKCFVKTNMALTMHTDKRENRWLSSNSEEERECSKIFFFFVFF